jgi:hypothetical protein
MSGIVILTLIYHRHKPIALNILKLKKLLKDCLHHRMKVLSSEEA